MKACRAGIGILAVTILFMILVSEGESASTRYSSKVRRYHLQPPPKPATPTTTPNPAISASKQRVLVVTGAVEHFSFLSGGEFVFGNNVDLSAGESENIVYLRMAGLVACVEDKEEAVNGKEAWSWLKDPVGGNVRKAEMYIGPPHPATVPISAEGAFFIPLAGKPKPNDEQYLLFTHNCTDSGEVITERFNLSLFTEHPPLARYSTLSQGHVFLPVSSHDTAFTRALAERAAFDRRNSWWGIGAPQSVAVEGFTWGNIFGGDPPGVTVKGRLYNWDYDSIPQPPERFNSGVKVPLHFDGRVTVGAGRNGTCNGVKLALYRGERKIMSGATSSADGPFRMYAEDGGLVEVMEPYSDWQLVVAHTCGKEWAVIREKFRFATNKRFGPQSDYSRAVRLETAN